MAYRYPIYRANDYNLRKQIMEALQSVSKWPAVQTSVESGDYAIIYEGSQLIVYESFTIGAGAFVQLDGTLIILGGAYRDEHAHSPYTLDASSGLYEIDGDDANLAADRIMQVASGSYTYTGENATLTGP